MEYNNLRTVQRSQIPTRHTLHSPEIVRLCVRCVRLCADCTLHNLLINNVLAAVVWKCAEYRIFL